MHIVHTGSDDCPSPPALSPHHIYCLLNVSEFISPKTPKSALNCNQKLPRDKTVETFVLECKPFLHQSICMPTCLLLSHWWMQGYGTLRSFCVFSKRHFLSLSRLSSCCLGWKWRFSRLFAHFKIQDYSVSLSFSSCLGWRWRFSCWLWLESSLLQSGCFLCHLWCRGRRGELPSSLARSFIILSQVHIWSVLTGASETVLRGHTSPAAAAVRNIAI